MNKEPILSKLHDVMLNRVSKNAEKGKKDFLAYPLLGALAVGFVAGEESDNFYNRLNQDIVNKIDSEIYALRGDMGSGKTDSRNRIKVASGNPAPIELRGYEEVVIRASSPRTQTR